MVAFTILQLTFLTLASFSFSNASLILSALAFASCSSWKNTRYLVYFSLSNPAIYIYLKRVVSWYLYPEHKACHSKLHTYRLSPAFLDLKSFSQSFYLQVLMLPAVAQLHSSYMICSSNATGMPENWTILCLCTHSWYKREGEGRSSLSKIASWMQLLRRKLASH